MENTPMMRDRTPFYVMFCTFICRKSTTASFALLFLVALASPGAQAVLLCQNGATFDTVIHECICTPHYYGRLCELSFLTSDPCMNWTYVQVLHDRTAMNRFGNNKTKCDEGSTDQQCIDFSEIMFAWYRFESPAGNNLMSDVSRCMTGAYECGSESPYILVDEVKEDNAEAILSKARAFRYRFGLSVGCYMPEDTYLPVRILRCSAVTLYYLQPLPTTAHYCIGDKAPCDAGLWSIDGTGFEPCIEPQCLPQLRIDAVPPLLKLDNNSKLNGLYRPSFYCNVFPAFNATDGVKYLIEFKLTYRNGTFILIPKCRHANVSIPGGQSKTFECRSEQVLTNGSNLYGGSLVCIVQARCNTSDSQFNSVPLESNSHSFFFSYWFMGGVDVIKPDQAVSLCISSTSIPVVEEVTLYISVGRQRLMQNDRIDVSVVRRDGNESLSCGFRMMNRRYKEKLICQDMILYNHDPESRVPLGLTTASQISVIKVNISFSSTAGGLNTYLPNGTQRLQKIHQIELKVDLSSLQTRVTTYMHAYTGPIIKPADSAYTAETTFWITSNGQSEQHYQLLRHRMLPYEIQGKVEGEVFTEVAIRYVYDVIHIHGISSSSGTLTYRLITKPLPHGVLLNPLPRKPDGLPFGVTLESTGSVIRVRFDLYGTILYIWGFQFNKGCTTMGCSGGVRPVPGRFVLDVMLVPGFYDTPNQTDGLIYGKNQLPISDPLDIILSGDFRLKRLQTSNKTMQPTEVQSICTCQEKDIPFAKGHCFVSIENNRTERRQAENLHPPIRLSSSPSSNVSQPQLFTRKISQQEADELCDEFATLQQSRSASTKICSSTKDPTGQADYISQFKLICAQYAAALGTFDFSQPLFNFMLGMCYTDMAYNATVVLSNATQIKAPVKDLCFANCSGRGICLNGKCTCDYGFWGTRCEMGIAQKDQLAITISLQHRNKIFCPSESCSRAYLMVRPLLKTAESVCLITGNPSCKYSVPSVHISGNIVMCDLKRVHKCPVRQVRMYEQLQIKVVADTWESSNAVDLLVHQTRFQGMLVACNENTMICQIGNRRVMNSGADDGANRCLRCISVRMTSASPSMLMIVVIGWLIK